MRSAHSGENGTVSSASAISGKRFGTGKRNHSRYSEAGGSSPSNESRSVTALLR